MKRTVLFILVVIIAALSVMSVSAAPRAGYYDQVGNKHWCNSDSYGCWVTGENGGKDYIMFWSEAAAEAIMGKNSGAPIGTLPVAGELGLSAPKIAAPDAEEEGGDVKPEPSPETLCKITSCETWETLENGNTADCKCVKSGCAPTDCGGETGNWDGTTCECPLHEES